MTFDPNDSIGYTDDGLVFLVVNSEMDGRKIKTIKTWTVEEARVISSELLGASEKAMEKRNVGNRTDIN